MEHVHDRSSLAPRAFANVTRWLLGGLLAFGTANAIAGAIYGLRGAETVPREWLAGSPFDDYFVPSFVLLVVVGGSMLVAATLVLTGARGARTAAIAAGLVLVTWIAVQVGIIGVVSWMQPATLTAALAILLLASTLPRVETGAREAARAFVGYYARAARHPTATFAALADDPRRVGLGTYALLSNAALYTLVYVFLVMGHGRPTVFRPWLAIDPEVYYRWDVFLLAPSVIAGWLLAGAVAQLAARRWGGAGSFEATTSALGFAIAIASWWTLAHDLVTSGLGAFGVIDQRAYEDAMSSPTPFRILIWTLMLAYAAAFLVLFAKAIAATHRLSAPRATAIGALAFAAYQGMFVLFNR